MTTKSKTQLKADVAATTAGGRQGEVVLDNIIDSYLDGYSPSPPVAGQGRLTLSTGVPVMTSDAVGATTIFYTPFVGRVISIYDGANFVATDFGGELSQATTDATKSPAAVAANKNYDMFVWNDGGTIRCTRGPAWSSDTARGSGAGTTELELFQGAQVNKNAITNGPAARGGTYVGTVRSNASSQIDWKLGGAGGGGVAAILGVWNMYNRRVAIPSVRDTTPTWTFTSNVPAALNGSNNNRVSLVVGLPEDGFSVHFAGAVDGGVANGAGYIGFGFNVTNSFIRKLGAYNPSSRAFNYGAVGGDFGPLSGFYFFQGVQAGDNVNTATAYGNAPEFAVMTANPLM